MIKFDETTLKRNSGCGFCMDYDWDKRTEVERDMSKELFEGKQINFCPFCGRELNKNLKNS